MTDRADNGLRFFCMHPVPGAGDNVRARLGKLS